jgi:threonyl-tRNA synthetase
MAPVQLAVLPVSDTELPSAAAPVVRRGIEQGLHAELVAPQRGTPGRVGQSSATCAYQAVIGPKEQAAGVVALCLRDGRHLDPLPTVDVVARISPAVPADRV